MALFRRNKSETTDVPSQIQGYYPVENRERAWVAWALGLATFLVTAVVVLGLFAGGRWAFRKLTDKPTETVSISEQPETPASTSAPATTPPATNNTPSTSGAPTATTTPQTSSTSTNTPSSTSNTSTDLPNTGPGNTLAIFVFVTALAYFAHRFYIIKRA